MNALVQKSLDRRFISRCCALMLCVLTTMPAWSASPKLLMAGGVFLWKQTNAEQAAYWGQTVGVQGFMMNEIMSDWNTDVGTDTDSDLWKSVRQFQSIYSQHGVTDNFIKVGLHSLRNWHNTWQNEAAVKNFAHAAALAKYAGFQGITLDLEPYQPAWGGAAGGLELASTVQREGRAIGQAMHETYPGMTLVIVQDVLHDAYQLHQPITAIANLQAMPLDSSKRYHGGYALAVPFLRGLLSVNWSHVVIATEETYKDSNIANVVQQTSRNYSAFFGDDAVWTNLSVSPGLWPLGLSNFDKSARETPGEFEQQLKTAFEVSSQYVWIYAYGSAWQTDGPYGAGPVTSNFQQYVDAIHRVRANYGASAPSRVHPSEPPALPVPHRAPAESVRQIRRPSRFAPAPAEGSSQPAGTLPRIVPLRVVGRGNAQS